MIKVFIKSLLFFLFFCQNLFAQEGLLKNFEGILFLQTEGVNEIMEKFDLELTSASEQDGNIVLTYVAKNKSSASILIGKISIDKDEFETINAFTLGFSSQSMHYVIKKELEEEKYELLENNFYSNNKMVISLDERSNLYLITAIKVAAFR